MPYAKDTEVPVSRSRAEIDALLAKHHVTDYVAGTVNGQIVYGFTYKMLRVRFNVPIPSVEAFSVTDAGRRRSARAAQSAHEQEQRRLWRALLLVIKAKLESVESGIETFEEAFLSQLVLPSGQTMGEWATPQFGRIAAGGQLPPLLTG